MASRPTDVMWHSLPTVISPAFHARSDKRLEVYDTRSDVYVADIQSHRIIASPLTASGAVYETFPVFSPDGRYVYYCAADTVRLPQDVTQMKYALVRIPFDSRAGRFGTEVDTLYSPSRYGQSVCHPRISPDGRYIVYTVADYGTFPIWHPESDLQLMDLQTGRIDSLKTVNSNLSDTYHSWSSNGRWLCFASKRGDGLYGKPYFCYVDKSGKAHKPFVLPQQNPEFYDLNLKSFNIPELVDAPLPFDAVDLQNAMKKDAERFTLVR